jgi:hypothetical protein
MDAEDLEEEAGDKFIARWLENSDHYQEYQKFRHIPLSEREGMRRAVFGFLARTVITYHNDPTEFSEIVAHLGYEQAAQQFDKRPKIDRTRKGNFGEIIACEYLRQVEDYELPVYRLRWNTNPDTSMRGEDAITFKFGNPDGTGREICITEAKVMSQYRGDTIQEAYTQLCSEHRPRPNSLPFIYSRLREKGAVEKANAVLDFLDRSLPHPPVRRHFLMIITGNQPQDPFRVVEDADEVVSNLTASNLSLNQLTEFINELFEVEIGGDYTD